MDRMIHKGESIDERLTEAENLYGKKIVDYMVNGWSDTSIALQTGLDEYTINRFRKKYKLHRKFRSDGVPYIDPRTIDFTKLERFGYYH